ncbi:MAG: ABC transporter ATP-binding protein [Planctomycetota bacterium]
MTPHPTISAKAAPNANASATSARRGAERERVLEDLPFSARRPLRTLYWLLDARWPAYCYLLLVFLIKNACFWGPSIAVALVVMIIEDPAYPAWMIWLPIGGQALLLAINIPGHVYYAHLLSQRIRGLERRLRAALVRRLQQLSLTYHNESESGRLQTKVMRDVEMVENLCRLFFQGGIEAMITIAIALGVALYNEPQVALFYILATPLCLTLLWLFRKPMVERNRDFRRGMEDVGSRVSEMIDMIPVTRAHGVEGTEVGEVDRRLFELRNRGIRLDRTNALFQASSFVVLRGIELVALAVFASMIIWSDLTIPLLVLFMGLFAQMVMSIMRLLHLFPQYARGLEALRSIGEVLECPDLEENAGKPAVNEVTGAITFDHVDYRYRNRAEHAVHDLSLHVEPGECIAFVGESGSGKSTTMNLVIGFYRPTGGRILLDGRDMQELDLRTWRRHIAVVPQNVILFSGNLRENITYGLDLVDESEIQAVVRAANLEQVVAQMPEGLDTVIGENGVQLSGGQRQRVAIARALIRDPRVIILDEATSSLDVIAEREVQQAIDNLVAGRTTFIVAHRLSTIRHADRVCVMKQGRCVELGPQDELLVRNGEFTKLKSLQS